MSLEIERKFLLKNDGLVEFLRGEGVVFKQLQISQFYTKITKNSELRYRSEDAKFIKTTKIGTNLIREESECECDEDEFRRALKQRIGAVLQKRRYLFKLNNNACNIDIFEGELGGLCTFEIEFKDEREAVFYRLPREIDDFIERDVTCDARYKNKHIALHGDPEVKFEPEFAFDLLLRHDIELNFPPNLPAKIALGALFFQILRHAQTALVSYLASQDEEALHQLRVNLRKTRSLLKIFSGVIDERVSGMFSENFKTLANVTNQKRDLDVFLSFLKRQKNAGDLAFFIEKAAQIEHEKIAKILSDDAQTGFLAEWELVLLERSGFYDGALASWPIERLGARAARAQLVRCLQRARKLGENSANESFHRLRIELKRLRYALESLNSLRLPSRAKFQARLRATQELFGELQDRDVWLDILDKLPRTELCEKLRNKIYRQIFSLREQILSRRMKFLRQARKLSRNLKIYYI